MQHYLGMYLKGVSTGKMGEALKALVDHETLGLSSSTVSRLKSENNDVCITVRLVVSLITLNTPQKCVEWKKVCDL